MGNKSQPSASKPKTSEEIAEEQYQAHAKYLPGEAQIQWDILNNPIYGLQAQTQLGEDVRRNVFGQEAGLSDALIAQTLSQLLSPTSLTPEQQAAVDSRRQMAMGKYQEAARNRANLGGNLYGGRSAASEMGDIGNLQNQFVEEDLQRQERQRLNALQIALSIYGGYRGLPLSQPQYLNPVPGPEAQLSSYTQARGQDIQQQIAQQQAQAQLKSALFGALGTAAGMALAPRPVGPSSAG